MIVFFLPNLRPGGAERVMLNVLLSYHIAYPNTKLVLLLGEKTGPLLAEIPTTIPIYSLGAANATKSIRPLIKFCKEHQPQVVFSSLGSALAASVAKRFVSSKIVFINRIGNTIGAEKLLFKNPIKRVMYLLANRFIGKNSNHIVFQCHYMAKDYIKETGVNPKNQSIIYNPVQVEKVEQLSNEKVEKEFTFIAVGRLNPQKDYKTLLDACAILKTRNSTFTLGIIGDGNLKEELQSQLKSLQLEENVFLMGFHANPYPYMKKARYLVSSSLYEGFSNVIIESLCLGTPVIATNCPGGNAEVIHDGKNGWLCKVHDATDLSNVMEKSLDQSVELDTKTIAENAQAVFHADIIFKRYEEVLNQYIK
ncbi:glycosyltransferase [Flavobacterium azooxidireducens]|uniref:Glycosyltransferase n=1 Tax=Flavobacterium azooxidireducens TaxID=1871076 RepID=A0ABY4KEP9_9FLAO|nr:glycosyltransferase [Flavobacterium azooxidireducens]UPQ79284.1 glycosyltransferase [Flavobacterium azooxidireducens]